MRFRFHRCLPLFLDKFKDVERKPFLKIGMELYYAAGPGDSKKSLSGGFKIFLDLKLHDIPNTVKKAMKVLSNLDVDMVNVHAAGTVEMMRAAPEGLTREDGTRPSSDSSNAADLHFRKRPCVNSCLSMPPSTTLSRNMLKTLRRPVSTVWFCSPLECPHGS